MSRKQQIYSDFSGGFNDSVAAISIKDSEVCISENADYAAEIKAFKTRKGCAKIKPNTTSFGEIVYDCHVWSVGSHYKKAIVMPNIPSITGDDESENNWVYDYDTDNDTLTAKIELSEGSKLIYPFVIFNKFYFGDGSELYEWGGFDHSSEEGTVTISLGKIVRNNNSTSGTSKLGHFYQAVTNIGNVNLTTATYSDTTKWEDVTEVEYFASNVCRVLEAYNAEQKEKVRIAVSSSPTTSGTISISLDNINYTLSIQDFYSVNYIVNHLKNAVDANNVKISGDAASLWTCEIDGNAAIFTKKTSGACVNGYVDPKSTGIIFTYTTVQEGKANDNDLSPVKKCTMFIVHTASYRVFACGNPEDNAIFYSEIGQPNYFKSAYQKIYALNAYGKPTGLIQLSDKVLVSFENGWYAWDGITALDDAKWKPLNIPYGCISNRSIVLTPNSFMFLSRDGIYNVSASILNSEIILLQSKNIIDKISRNRIDNVINSIYDKSKCQAIFYENVYYLAYNTDSSDVNNRVLKFEWNTQSFTEITGWEVNAWCSDNEHLYFASDNYLLIANVGYNDVNTETGADKPIELYIKTKEYHFGNPLMNKLVNFIGVIFKQPDDYSYDVRADIRIIYGYDYFDVDTMNISESLIWNRNWGLLWGFREAIPKLIETSLVSNTFQLEIKNNRLNSPVSIVAIGFVFEETDFITTSNYKDEDLLR